MMTTDGWRVPAGGDRRSLKADGPSILRIGFDPEEFAKLLPDQQQEFVRWHVVRVLSGATSAVDAWENVGLKVDIRPWRERR